MSAADVKQIRKVVIYIYSGFFMVVCAKFLIGDGNLEIVYGISNLNANTAKGETPQQEAD